MNDLYYVHGVVPASDGTGRGYLLNETVPAESKEDALYQLLIPLLLKYGIDADPKNFQGTVQKAINNFDNNYDDFKEVTLDSNVDGPIYKYIDAITTLKHNTDKEE